MAANEPLSRRGIVGFIAALAAAPQAVAAEATETLRDMIHPDYGPPQGVAGVGGLGGQQPLSLEQLAMKHMMVESSRQVRRRQNGIRRCRSMSEAAKQAYCRDAEREGSPIHMRWAKLMGWRPPNDDLEDW